MRQDTARQVDGQSSAAAPGEGAGHAARGDRDGRLAGLRAAALGRTARSGDIVQGRFSGRAGSDAYVHTQAELGFQGNSSPLPHLDQLQEAFGHHDLSDVQAYRGSSAQAANGDIGAQAYASGNRVAFGGAADLHTAAHEAAHVVQQRSGSVSVPGGVGQAGDAYERHADRVADAVVQGKSAESLLNPYAASPGSAPVQARAVQRQVPPANAGSQAWANTQACRTAEAEHESRNAPTSLPRRGVTETNLEYDAIAAAIHEAFESHERSVPESPYIVPPVGSIRSEVANALENRNDLTQGVMIHVQSRAGLLDRHQSSTYSANLVFRAEGPATSQGVRNETRAGSEASTTSQATTDSSSQSLGVSAPAISAAASTGTATANGTGSARATGQQGQRGVHSWSMGVRFGFSWSRRDAFGSANALRWEWVPGSRCGTVSFETLGPTTPCDAVANQPTVAAPLVAPPAAVGAPAPIGAAAPAPAPLTPAPAPAPATPQVNAPGSSARN